jgi:hypothetical protein
MCRVFWQIVTNVSEKPAAYIFRVEEQGRCGNKWHQCRERKELNWSPERSKSIKEDSVKDVRPFEGPFSKSRYAGRNIR